METTALPVPPAVAASCDMLGLDPLHVANEGCLVAFVAADRADQLLAAMRSLPGGAGAVRVGTVLESNPGQVTVRTLLGARRVVDMLIGEQLPRIC